ncbi:MAG: hypothetical protein RR247_04120 [Clostridia bacterium]
MNRTEFNKRIQDNFDEFKTQTLNLTKEEIFENSFEINVKDCLAIYLQDEDTLEVDAIEKIMKIDGNIINELYDLCLDYEDGSEFFDISEEIVESYLGLYGYDEQSIIDNGTKYSKQENMLENNNL